MISKYCFNALLRPMIPLKDEIVTLLLEVETGPLVRHAIST